MISASFLLFIVLLFLSTIFFRSAAGSLSINRINPISTFYYFVLLLFIIGCGIRLLGFYSIKMTIQGFPLSQPGMRNMSLLLGGWFFCVGLVFLCLSRVFPANKVYRFRNVNYGRGGRSFSFMGAVFLCTIVFISIVYVGVVFRGYPIIDLIQEGGLEARISRRAFKADFGGIEHIKNILANVGAVIAAGMSLVIFLTNNKSFKTYCLLSFSWSLFLFVSIWDVTKSSMVWFILYYLVIRILLGKSYGKRIILYGMLAIFSIGIMYFFTAYESSLDLLLATGGQAILNRVFLGQSDGMFYTYSYWPSSSPFLGVSGTSHLIAAIFGEQYVNPMRLMMTEFSPGAIVAGTGGVRSTLFIAQAYAVGGMAMVVISTLITIGMIYFFYYIFTTKCRKTPLNVAMYAYFLLFFVKSLGSGFFTNVIVNWVYVFFMAMILLRELIASVLLVQRSSMHLKSH